MEFNTKIGLGPPPPIRLIVVLSNIIIVLPPSVNIRSPLLSAPRHLQARITGRPIYTAKSKKLEAYRNSLPLRVEYSVEELRKIFRLTGWSKILLGGLNDSLSGGPGRPSTEVQLIPS
ncbi:unnamed protein product [Nezara viridula]|uniref:Uncharacterized protein n=1 Tax=Nezara viridula TaxID=85310 RepID=A0A9P0HH84_NEZVI|nr:unnamed protein product [Nezara viridula]